VDFSTADAKTLYLVIRLALFTMTDAAGEDDFDEKLQNLVDPWNDTHFELRRRSPFHLWFKEEKSASFKKD